MPRFYETTLSITNLHNLSISTHVNRSRIYKSVIIDKDTQTRNVCEIIRNLREKNPNLKPDDVAIILIDDSKDIYKYIDKLCLEINKRFKWSVSRGYESKETIDGRIYISNPNNIKGLEFPYVICITHKIIKSYKYRNTLYTMLTRSFIQTFLLVSDDSNLETFINGLNMINTNQYIETTIPTEQQIQKIRQTLVKYQEGDDNLSYRDFLETIFAEQGIVDENIKETLTQALSRTNIEKFDKDQTYQFIEVNKKFFQ